MRDVDEVEVEEETGEEGRSGEGNGERGYKSRMLVWFARLSHAKSLKM